MAISHHEFNRQCLEFVELDPDDGWHLAVKQPNSSLAEFTADISIAQLLGDDARLLLMKNETRMLPHTHRVCNYEYTVIYSESFEVPVMYFCVSDQNGAQVPLADVITTDRDDLSKIVNQVEHPLIFRPFFMIHPCRTKDFMEPHARISLKSYLVSWLSTVATLLGLRLDPRLALNLK